MRAVVLFGLLFVIGIACAVLTDEEIVMRMIRAATPDSSKSSEEKDNDKKAEGTDEKKDDDDSKEEEKKIVPFTENAVESIAEGSGEAEPAAQTAADEGSGADETFFPKP